MLIRRFFGILLCAGCAAAAAPAQELTLDDILKRNTEALGGAEAIAKIQTLRISASMNTQTMGTQMDASMIIQAKRPNMVRTEMNVMGNAATAAYDGETAWMINPMSGSSEPQKIDPSMTGGMVSATVDNSVGSLASFKAAGHTAELAGREEVAGVNTYKVKVTFKTGMVATYFLDEKTFLPAKTITRLTMMGQLMDVETFPSDYKKVGDVLFAHAVKQAMNGNVVGSLTYHKIEVNVPMEDSIFKMPVKETPPVKKAPSGF